MGTESTVYVTGTKEGLDENLTSEEQDALSRYFAALLAQQDTVDLTLLDASLVETIRKIWIVRKRGMALDPVLKSTLYQGPENRRPPYGGA